MGAVSQNNQERCPICHSDQVAIFFELSNVPVLVNVLWPSRAEALNTAKGDLRLAHCQACSYIFNQAFDSTKTAYDQAYENSLHYSKRFQEYAEALAQGLIQRFQLTDKTIIEVGCGQADFLTRLCELGGNRGFGFDPSFRNSSETKHVGSGTLQVIPESYNSRHVALAPDFLCSRHVLEHIPEPAAFLDGIKRAIGFNRNCGIYFEVPNVKFMLRDLSVWDFIYEHVSYFCAQSLQQLFNKCGFTVRQVSDTYDGQFLAIEADSSALPTAKESGLEQTSGLTSDVSDFAAHYQTKRKAWRQFLTEFQAQKKRLAVWGAGSKGVMFLNAFTDFSIEHIVDINPRKKGMFVSGSGQRIVAPEHLLEYQPDAVVIMNPIYGEEIRGMLTGLGLTPTLMSENADII